MGGACDGSPLSCSGVVSTGVQYCWCKRYGYDWHQAGLLRFLPTSANGEAEDEEEEEDEEEDDEEEEEEQEERKRKGGSREAEERNAREYVQFSRSAASSVASSSSSSSSSSSLEPHDHAENKGDAEEEMEAENTLKGKPKKRTPSSRGRATTTTPVTTSSSSSRRKEKWWSLLRAIGRECSQLLHNPPFLSIGVGMLLGLVPPLHRAFFGHGPLEVITDSMVLIAQGNIPASLLLLGANLAGTKQLTLGGGDEEDALVEGDDEDDDKDDEVANENANNTNTNNKKKKKKTNRRQREKVRAEKELLKRAGVRLCHGGRTELRHAGTSTEDDAILLHALKGEKMTEDTDETEKHQREHMVAPGWRTIVTTTAGEVTTTAFRTPPWKRPGTTAIVEIGKATRFPTDAFASPFAEEQRANGKEETERDGQKEGGGVRERKEGGVIHVLPVCHPSSSASSLLAQKEKNNHTDGESEEESTFTVRWKYNAEGKRICQYPDAMGHRVGFGFSADAEEEEEKTSSHRSNFFQSFLKELQGMVALTGVSHRFVFGVIFFRLLVIPFFFFLLLVFLVKAFPFLFGGRGKEDVTLVLTLFVEVAAPTAINSTIMFAMENFMTYHWAKMLFLQYILSIGSVVLWTWLGLKFTETLVPGNERLEGLLPSL